MFALDAEARARVTRLKANELVILALTLGVLGAEALWIFGPTARYVKSSMQSLDRAHSRQQAMLEALPDAVLLFDAEGRTLEAYPPSARELVGAGRDQFRAISRPRAPLAAAKPGSSRTRRATRSKRA